jgi:hypothetical protein
MTTEKPKPTGPDADLIAWGEELAALRAKVMVTPEGAEREAVSLMVAIDQIGLC